MCVCHPVAEYMTCTVSFGNSNFLKKAVFCTNTQLSQTQHTQQERGTSESNGLNISSVIFIVVPCCMMFQSLLYCSNSCTSLHFNPLAYTDVSETAGLASSINTQPAVRRNSETNPTSQHNRGMY